MKTRARILEHRATAMTFVVALQALAAMFFLADLVRDLASEPVGTHHDPSATRIRPLRSELTLEVMCVVHGDPVESLAVREQTVPDVLEAVVIPAAEVMHQRVTVPDLE